MTKFFEVGDRVRVVWVDDEDAEVGVMAGDVATVEAVSDPTLQVKFDYGLQRFMLRRQMEVVE